MKTKLKMNKLEVMHDVGDMIRDRIRTHMLVHISSKVDLKVINYLSMMKTKIRVRTLDEIYLRILHNLNI